MAIFDLLLIPEMLIFFCGIFTVLIDMFALPFQLIARYVFKLDVTYFKLTQAMAKEIREEHKREVKRREERKRKIEQRKRTK